MQSELEIQLYDTRFAKISESSTVNKIYLSIWKKYRKPIIQCKNNDMDNFGH
jgi:hypothetical protein